MAEELNILKKVVGKFEKTMGVRIWGVDSGGNPVSVLVKPNGTVVVEGTVSVSGDVDVSDRWNRQVGQVDIARYLGSAIGLANPLHSQIVYGGVAIDPRQIRAITETLTVQATDLDIRNLVKTQDEVYSVLRTDAGVAYDARDRNWVLGASDVPDLSDRATRLLGKVYGNQDVLQQRPTTKELYAQLSHQGTEYDARQIRALTSSDVVDVSDRATRLLGVVYGSQGQQLLQRATTYDLLVQLRHQGAEIDPRAVDLSNADISQIRWGIPREPTWINGSNQTAPTTTTDLVSKTVTTGKTGRIFGWQIISPEANEFILNIGATAYRIGALGGAGVICVLLSNPIFDSIASGTTINIRVATAGGTGKVYRADLAYDEA